MRGHYAEVGKGRGNATAPDPCFFTADMQLQDVPGGWPGRAGGGGGGCSPSLPFFLGAAASIEPGMRLHDVRDGWPGLGARVGVQAGAGGPAHASSGGAALMGPRGHKPSSQPLWCLG